MAWSAVVTVTPELVEIVAADASHSRAPAVPDFPGPGGAPPPGWASLALSVDAPCRVAGVAHPLHLDGPFGVLEYTPDVAETLAASFAQLSVAPLGRRGGPESVGRLRAVLRAGVGELWAVYLAGGPAESTPAALCVTACRF